MKYRLGFEISRTSRLIRRHLDNGATKSYIDKLTGTHGRALGYFWHNRNRDIYQKDFEKEFNIRRSTASTMLSLMEKNGLITREGVPHDARLKKIILTDKAKEIQKYVDRSLDTFEEKLSEGITDEEAVTFMTVLGKIKSNLERIE